MTAVPAWPPHSLPRLFVDQLLSPGQSFGVEGSYLGAVLRLGAGDKVKVFDDRTGEWLAEIAEINKKRAILIAREKLGEREDMPDLWLLFAPIKRGRIDWLIEKATELGVARLMPVLTQRTVVDRLNLDRLRAHAIEAAEQCERTALPKLDDPQKLGKLLSSWPDDRTLYFADEGGGEAFTPAPGPAAILIGPEGGFTDEERAEIRALPQALPVSLGPRILRADTAAIAALSLWMAAAGDWRRPPRDGEELGSKAKPAGG